MDCARTANSQVGASLTVARVVADDRVLTCLTITF